MNEYSLVLNRSSYDMLNDWELGELDCDETIQLFQSLINSGLAYKLNQRHADAADQLIDAGYCNPRRFP